GGPGEPACPPGRNRRGLGRPVPEQASLEVVTGVARQQLLDPARVELVDPGARHVDERSGGDEPSRVGQVVAGSGGDVRGYRGADRGRSLRGLTAPERETLGALASHHGE